MAGNSVKRGNAPRMKIETTSVEEQAPSVQSPVQPTPAPARSTQARAPRPKLEAAPAKSTTSANPAPPKATKQVGVESEPPKTATKPPAGNAQAKSGDEAPSNNAHTAGLDSAAVEGARSFEGARNAAKGWVSRTFPGHENAFWGGVVALVLALLVFAIGFLRVLFICVLVVLGVALGQVLDGDAKIIRTVRELFSFDRNQK